MHSSRRVGGGKQTGQQYGHTLFHWYQQQKFERMLLKWPIIKGWNPEHQVSQTLRLSYAVVIVSLLVCVAHREFILVDQIETFWRSFIQGFNF